MNNFDLQYTNVMKRVIDTGVDRPDRTGVGSRAIWGAMVDVDLADGFPIPTTRKTAFRIAQEETWWMLRGETDTKKLEEKKINIWKGNTTREFLDNRGLKYLPEGHMGKGYGFQWRNFGGDYDMPYFDPGKMNPLDPKNKNFYVKDNNGVDQVIQVLEGMKKDPNGRRHIISGWNPQQLHEMALPPCHLYNQYQILNGKLNSSFVMRSHDWLYGGPFNFMGYALLNIAFAKYLGLEPGHLTYFGNDVHIYDNQIEMAKEQVLRDSFDLPKIELVKPVKTLDDLFGLQHEDFVFTTEYKAHPDFKNKPKMAV
jgi:thymidylate synthase